MKIQSQVFGRRKKQKKIEWVRGVERTFLPPLLCFSFLISCSPQKKQQDEVPLQKTYFDSMDGAPPPVQGTFAEKSSVALASKKRKPLENLKIKTQVFQDYQVEGTYLKQISTVKGRKRFQASSSFEPTADLKLQISALNEKQKIFSKMHQSLASSQGRQLVSLEPERKIIWTSTHGWQPVLGWLAADASGELWRTLRNVEFQEVRTERVGSGFADQHKAFLYPESPVRTQIEEVQLGFLNENPQLENELIELTTESSSLARSDQAWFKYKPEEDEFDQVQAFYFASRFLSWVQSSFQIGFGQKLQIQTHVGYPQRTNTMFYYGGKVRLGAGDGGSFDQVMKDPSIVMHESAHFLIDQMAALPFQGEGGSINEGFADALTAIHLKSPYMGEASYKKQPYKRSLDNSLRVQDKTGKLYADSLIVSGTFWKMYQAFGEDMTKQVIFYTLERLHPGSDFQHLQSLLQEAIVVFGPGRTSYNEILKEKGWLGNSLSQSSAE